MSGFNLMPWREQRRLSRLRSWRWGWAMSLAGSVAVVWGWDQAWNSWLANQQARQKLAEQTMSQWQSELSSGNLWQNRARMAQQVQTDWQQWRQQQIRAWQLMQQWLTVPARGVQIERVVWRDQQWQVSGWALSAGHWQNWQTALVVAGFSPQTDQSQWAEAQWRLADGIAAKQHPFQLTLAISASPVKP
ncbi:MAG: hypothetical protein ACKO5X_06780 [Limnohabitans sp.]